MIWGVVLALGAAAAWAHNSIVYTFAGRRVGSRTTAHIRMWFALPISLLIMFIFTGRIVPSAASALSLGASAVSGITGYFIADILIFQAFLHLGPRDTMLVLTTSPLFSALLSWMVYGETLSALSALAAVVILVGVALVISDVTPAGGLAAEEDLDEASRKREKLVGVILALGGSLAQAVGIIFSKYSLLQGDGPTEVNVVRLTAGLIAFTAYLIARREFISDFGKMTDRRALFFIAFGALIGPSLGVLGALYSVLYIPVGIAAVLMQTTPVMLLPIERLLFRRKIHVVAVVGTLTALAGISLLILG
jgi:drug/metabolite transporter (DMT)-like permease